MSETTRKVRVLITLQVEKIQRAKKISRKTIESAAVQAIKSALDRPGVPPPADGLCIGFVDAVLYEGA